MTPADLHALTPQAQTKLFTDLAGAYYGPNFKAAVSRDFRVSQPVPFTWIRNNTVPPAVIYALDAWVTARQATSAASSCVQCGNTPPTSAAA